MRKEEIIKITNEELVNKLGAEQLEWFRKVIYSYRKRDLLFLMLSSIYFQKLKMQIKI